MAKEVKPTEIHLPDDDYQKGQEGLAVYHYYKSGRGNYDSAGTNTSLESQAVILPDELKLPRVRCGVSDAEIDYGNRTYCGVPLNAAEALQLIVESFPLPVGLKAKIGAHPERAIDKLPEALRSHVVAVPGNKGYRFTLR